MYYFYKSYKLPYRRRLPYRQLLVPSENSNLRSHLPQGRSVLPNGIGADIARLHPAVLPHCKLVAGTAFPVHPAYGRPHLHPELQSVSLNFSQYQEHDSQDTLHSAQPPRPAPDIPEHPISSLWTEVAPPAGTSHNHVW